MAKPTQGCKWSHTSCTTSWHVSCSEMCLTFTGSFTPLDTWQQLQHIPVVNNYCTHSCCFMQSLKL